MRWQDKEEYSWGRHWWMSIWMFPECHTAFCLCTDLKWNDPLFSQDCYTAVIAMWYTDSFAFQKLPTILSSGCWYPSSCVGQLKLLTTFLLCVSHSLFSANNCVQNLSVFDCTHAAEQTPWGLCIVICWQKLNFNKIVDFPFMITTVM